MTETERVKEASLIHRGLGRVEFFDLTDEEMEAFERTLAPLAAEGRSKVSFHAPVHRPTWFPHVGVTCFFLSEDEDKRELSFRLLGHTIDLARAWEAEYVVTHLTFGPTDTKNESRAADLASMALERMAGMSRDSGLPIDVEFAAYTDSYHHPETFAAAVGAHSELGICIDVGHTCLGSIKRGRPFLDDIAALAPGARSMHLWNTTGPEHTAMHHHTALHPSQSPTEGWIDLPAAVETVRAHNPDVNVIFEYPITELTPDIQAGYDWVAEMVAR